MPVRLLAALVALGSLAAFGQTPLPLHDATPVRLRLTRDLSYSAVQPADMIYFEILDDLRIDGVLVIAHGARATATTIETESKSLLGRGGRLGIELDTIPLVNGDNVPIRTAIQSRRAGKMDAAEGSADVAILPAASPLIFTLGRRDSIPEGAIVTAYIDGDVQVDASKFLVDLTITSSPQGAVVRMYGTPIGRTPFTTRLMPGTYKAVFSAEGRPDLTESIPVGPGHPSTVEVRF